MTTTIPLSSETRAKKVAQITALLAKTVARGCSPDEEIAARVMADRLMAKYGIDIGECVEQVRIDPLQNLWDAMRRASQQSDAYETAKARAREDQKRRDQERRNDQARQAYARQSADYAWAREAPDEAWEPSAAHGTTTHRKNKSHARCDHDNTSAARARCRRMGGPDDSKLF